MINITSSSDYVAFNPTSLLYLESNWALGIPKVAQWLSRQMPQNGSNEILGWVSQGLQTAWSL